MIVEAGATVGCTGRSVRAMTRRQIPGVAVLVRRGGDTVRAKG